MKKHSSLTLLVFIAVLALMWILAGWNTMNFDLPSYETRYEVIRNDGFNLFKRDFGFDFIEYIFVLLNFQFSEYHIIIYAISLCFLGYIIYKWSFTPVFVLIFYIICHFVKDIVETRNFIACLFMLFTINYWGKSYKNRFAIIFLLLLTSFSIHMSFLFYFVFLFLFIEKRKWNYWTLMMSSIIFSYIGKWILGEVAGLLAFEGMDDKVDDYMNNLPVWATIVASCLAVVNGICINYFYKVAISNKSIRQIRVNNLSSERYSQIMYNLNSMTNVFLVLTSINFTFYARLFTNFQLLNFIYFLNVIYLNKRNRLFNYFVVLIYTFIFLFFTQISPFWEHLAFILGNNSLLFE